MTISESGSASSLATNATQTIPPWRHRIAAILCLLGSLILGGFGIAKTIDEHRELNHFYSVRDLSQKTKDEVHRTAEGYESTIVGVEAQNIEDAEQSWIDDAQRSIDQHRIQEWFGVFLIAGGVAFLVVGIVLFRKRAQQAPVGSVNAASENGRAEIDVASPLQPPDVAPEIRSRSQHGGAMIGAGAILVVITIFAYLISISTAPSAGQASDSSNTQPSATSVEPSTASAPSQAPAAPQGSWQLSSDTNPVTGEVTTAASLHSDINERQYIIVRLVGKTLDCYINTDEFLETIANIESHTSTVQYKFDAGKVVRQGWTLSADNEALFYPGNCATFIAQLRKAKNLAFEFRPSEKIPETITFDVEGFPAEFKAGS